MKNCPQCSRPADDVLQFCRYDGARLVEAGDWFSIQRTIALDPNVPMPTVPLEEATLPESRPIVIAAPTTVMNGGLTSPPITRFLRDKKKSSLVALGIICLMLTMWAYRSLTIKGTESIQSLAVLPFINVNADQQLEYLSDGITDMLICNLSRLQILNVKARSSVFCYKGKDVTPHTVGSDLNVQAILNGRIVLHGDMLTLSLELADARTENIIWSEQYNRKKTDLVSLQSEVALDVFNKLRMKLTGAEQQTLSKKDTTNEDAYEFYLKGRLFWNRRTLKDLEKAADYFNKAIALDPNYALAYVGLADAYTVLPLYRDEPMHQAMQPAREAAMKALSLDGELAEPHATLGRVYTHEYDFEAAEREYRRAIELEPNYATAHQWYGLLLLYLARNEEALTQLHTAVEIEPVSPIINTSYAEGFFYTRRYDDAVSQLKKTLELDSEFSTAYRNLAKYYQQKGDYARTASSYAKYRDLIGDHQTAKLIRESFANGGWQGCLRALTAPEQLPKLSRYEVVAFRIALGDKDGAIDELSKSYETFGPLLLKIEPLLDPLRGDPRFADIIHRAGLS
jgi:TolB-like protein/Tfp pilus assembly protein PilF